MAEGAPMNTTQHDRRLVGSLFWTALGKWGGQAVSWGSVFVIARLVSPGEFGLVAMANTYMGLLTLIGEFGIMATVVNVRGLDSRDHRQLNSISLLIGLLAMAVTAAGAVPLAEFFREPQLRGLLLTMGLGFPFASLRAVPMGLLQRELRHKTISMVEVSQVIFQALVSLGLALWGAGSYALVVGTLAGTIWGSMGMLYLKHPGYTVPEPRRLKEVLKFSWAVLTSNVCWYAYSNSDFFVAGRVLGAKALGAYSMAWSLSLMPAEKVATVIMRVLPGFFSHHAENLPELRRYVCLATEGLALLTFPMALGLMLTAPLSVPLLLGPGWTEAIVPLMLLAGYAALMSLAMIVAQILLAVGKPKTAMWNTVLKAVVMPAAFWYFSRWGGKGIAMAWLIFWPVLTAPMYWSAFRAVQMPAGQYLAALRPALGCSTAILIATGTAILVLPAEWPAVVRLVVEIVAGVAGTAVALATVHRARMKSFYESFQAMRRGPGK